MKFRDAEGLSCSAGRRDPKGLDDVGRRAKRSFSPGDAQRTEARNATRRPADFRDRAKRQSVSASTANLI